MMTLDIDIVHSRKPGNLPRLIDAITEMDGYYRMQASRRLRPNESHIASPGHQLLMTRFGAVDFLGEIGTHEGYGELLPHSIPVQIEEGLTVLILSLETLIRLKTEAGRDKDLATLPTLRATLEEKRRGKA